MITEYTDRNEWKAAVEARGLMTVTPPGFWEGPHESDRYLDTFAVAKRELEGHECEAFGHGSLCPTATGGDEWFGVLADSVDEYLAWVNEPPTEEELAEMWKDYDEAFAERRAHVAKEG